MSGLVLEMLFFLKLARLHKLGSFINRTLFGIYLKLATPINRSSKLALEFCIENFNYAVICLRIASL